MLAGWMGAWWHFAMPELVWDPSESAGLLAFRELVEEYQVELGVDLCFQGFQEEMAGLPGAYSPPLGAILLLRDGTNWAGCGAIRPLSPGVCEIKRMYLRPAIRSQGFGAVLMQVLLNRAKELGHHSVRLDTLRRLTPALALYTRFGFNEIEAYNYNPEADIVYMERAL